MTDPSSRIDPEKDRRLGEAVAAYFAAIEAGGAPDRGAILAAYPDLAADLAEFFDHEERLGRLIGPVRSPEPADVGIDEEATIAGPGGSASNPDSGATVAGEPTIDLPEADANGRDDPLARGARVRYFGDYELSGVLGRGGMGIVYKAAQLSLNRVVALKMIRSGHWADDEEVRRFRNEAEAVANLDHPLILPIYEVGRYQDQHYFSMKLVPGGSLEKRLGGFQADVRAAGRLVDEVARAVHHAHQRGLLHRDLKPSNILLDAEGRPHVADFGLAKRIEGDGAASISGAIVGTPPYMSPEQASGRRASVTTATDVYGLGALLYACLTGGPPFQGDDVVATLRRVVEQLPEPPSQSNPRVDRDLETICLKCLEKDPRRRYDSASALADDLDRWLRGEPIVARRTGAWERLAKWSRRRPAAAALVAMSGIAMLTMAGLGVALFIHSQLRSAYSEVQRQRKIAEAALESERTFLYQNRILFAERELNDNNTHRAEGLLDECPPDRRNWEWNYLKRQCHAELATIEAQRGWVRAFAISPDGRLFATGSLYKEPIRIWDVQSRRLLRTLPETIADVWSLAFNPEATLVASVGGSWNQPEPVLVREVATGRTVRRIPVGAGLNSTVRFSPDGTKIIVASGEVSSGCWVKACEAQSGRERLTIPTGSRPVFNASLSPDGRNIVAVVGSGKPDSSDLKLNEVRVWAVDWDANTYEERLVCHGHSKPLLSVSFSPDGKKVAACGYDPIVRIYDAGDGRERMAFRGHRDCVNNIVFSPDGLRVATPSDDGSAKIWSVETGQVYASLRGHRGGVFSIGFTPDGHRLLTGGYDGAVKIWDATSSPEARTIAASQSPVWSIAFSPDGRRLISAGMDRTLRVWEVPSSRLLATWSGHSETVWSVASSPDGTRVASAAGDWRRLDQLGEINIWDAAAGRIVHALRGHKGSARCVSFSRDGRRLVSGGGEVRTPGQEVIVWDADTGSRLRSFSDLKAGVSAVAFGRDERVVVAGVGGVLHAWDLETGRPLFASEGHNDDISGIAFSLDGKRIFTSGEDATIRVWDAADGRLLQRLFPDKYRTRSISISDDGRRLVSGGSDQTVKLWDASTGQQMGSLLGHSAPIHCVVFSQGGSWIASSDDDGWIKLWDGAPWQGGNR